MVTQLRTNERLRVQGLAPAERNRCAAGADDVPRTRANSPTCRKKEETNRFGGSTA
jgi:hypothetical protein